MLQEQLNVLAALIQMSTMTDDKAIQDKLKQIINLNLDGIINNKVD